MRERFGVESDAIWTDDGIIMHLPDLDVSADDQAEALPSAAELLMIEPQEVEQAVIAELGGSALFGARFRENAARALLIPRAYPGRRTPLWQQRLKAQNLLEVARRYDDFPIILETYRECLRDVLDLDGLREVLTALQTREISLVEVETPVASPFASSLLFDYVATYMYEGDAPAAERRAAALSLDRDLLRELLGQEELRELIDPGAAERVQDDLQCRSEMTRATDRDGLHDVLRRVGDLTEAEVRERVFPGVDADALLAVLERERRAVRLRIAGEERLIAADEAGLYRDAVGAAPPGGLPESFLADVPDALRELVARYAATRGPFGSAELHRRYGVDPSAVLRELERDGQIVRGELKPGGDERDWCDTEVLRRLRRASLAALRKEIEPTEQRRLAAFLPSWQGVDRHTSAGAGVDRLREVLVALQGLALPAEIWERDVLPRRIGAYSPTWLDALCAGGELLWVGAGPLGRSGRVALYFREDAALIGPPPGRSGASVPGASEHELLRNRLRAGPAFFTDLLAELAGSPQVLTEALWDLVWAGEVTNDAWAPLRAPRLALARGERYEPGARQRGRSRFAARRSSDLAAAPDRRRALAELLLERYGVVTREQVLAEGVKGGFAMLYDTFARLETLGLCRRGYFIEGMGGAQFALPGAVERLRAALPRESERPRTSVLAAADPAQPYGAALPWPRRGEGERRPARVAGAYVVTVSEQPALYVERGGRGLITLLEDGQATLLPGQPDAVGEALVALAEAVRSGRVGKLSLERIDGEPAISSRYLGALSELGFKAGPRRLTLSA